jgi:hypothetical protein
LIDSINIDGTVSSDSDNIYDFLHNDVSLQVISLYEIYKKFTETSDVSEYEFEQGTVYDYKTNIKNLWAVLNGFRSNLNTLVSFIDD